MKNPNRFEYTVFIFKQILKNLVSLCQAHRMTGDTGVGKKKNKHLEQKNQVPFKLLESSQSPLTGAAQYHCKV